MAIPRLVPISYEPDYRTAHIGHYDEGQFFGSVTATIDDGSGADVEWSRSKRWYAVLHRFDARGAHTGSDIWFAGTSAEQDAAVERARDRLGEWLAELPGAVFGDIAVRLFRVEAEGRVFGLVDESAEYGEAHAEFLPDELGFDHPWDGSYDV